MQKHAAAVLPADAVSLALTVGKQLYFDTKYANIIGACKVVQKRGREERSS